MPNRGNHPKSHSPAYAAMVLIIKEIEAKQGDTKAVNDAEKETGSRDFLREGLHVHTTRGLLMFIRFDF